MFTDPITKIGGEKCSYHIPTYEALKGVAKSIYWKPTLIWVIDAVRVMKRIRTQTKGTKPIDFGGGNRLAYYTFLTGDADPRREVPGVEYQVRAHFIWNEHRPELEGDRIDGKHFQLTLRSLERGGRQDVFLGTRDCQGYVEPCEFGSDEGAYDGDGRFDFGLMFHSFDYPDETGTKTLMASFWRPTMENGVIRFPRPHECFLKKEIREMNPKKFVIDGNMASSDQGVGES